MRCLRIYDLVVVSRELQIDLVLRATTLFHAALLSRGLVLVRVALVRHLQSESEPDLGIA
jgi:hypothetical protein